MRGRFAPSPTGELHVGSLSTALLAWLQVRAAGGQFLLRVEDLDRARAVPGMVDAQLDALEALGLSWDEGPRRDGPFGPYVQSARAAHYSGALDTLERLGLLYPCYCSRAEVREEAEGKSPVYPGTCRSLTATQRAEREGRGSALRFRVRAGTVVFEDAIFGRIAQDVQREVGDFVVRRRDGVIAYQLAVVVDDAAMAIDQVLRGADLLDSTPRQLLLYEALGAPAPAFAHVPLWVGRDGGKLGKRHGQVGIQTRLRAGESPGSLLSEVARGLGLRSPVSHPRELLAGFEVRALGTAARVWTPAGG